MWKPPHIHINSNAAVTKMGPKICQKGSKCPRTVTASSGVKIMQVNTIISQVPLKIL
jgi:hypothetical protein